MQKFGDICLNIALALYGWISMIRAYDEHGLTIRFYCFHDKIRGLTESSDEACLQLAYFVLLGGEV